MLNTETIVHPRLQHLSLTRGRVDDMIHWYRVVLGMNLRAARGAVSEPVRVLLKK
jgi:hypothetical protein